MISPSVSRAMILRQCPAWLHALLAVLAQRLKIVPPECALRANHTFVDGDATTTACSPCSEVLNAAAEATYTCTGDSDSDVSACLYVWMASGKIPQAPLQSAAHAPAKTTATLTQHSRA